MSILRYIIKHIFLSYTSFQLVSGMSHPLILTSGWCDDILRSRAWSNRTHSIFRELPTEMKTFSIFRVRKSFPSSIARFYYRCRWSVVILFLLLLPVLIIRHYVYYYYYYREEHSLCDTSVAQRNATGVTLIISIYSFTFSLYV